MTRVPLEQGGKTLHTIAATLHQRLDDALAVDVGSFREFSKPVRDAARRFWSQRAWSEYAAIPALSQLLLEGVRQQVSLDETAALTGILHDESLHTALAQRAACALGGYVDEVPDDLAYDPYVFAEPASRSLAHWVVTGGCLGETISRALIGARLKATTHAGLRAIVERTYKDESLHVAYSWAVAARVLPTTSKAEKKELAERVAASAAAARRGGAKRGLSKAARATQAKLRGVVADAGLGSIAADEEEAVVVALFDAEIVPGLRALGLPLPG